MEGLAVQQSFAGVLPAHLDPQAHNMLPPLIERQEAPAVHWCCKAALPVNLLLLFIKVSLTSPGRGDAHVPCLQHAASVPLPGVAQRYS